MQGLTCCRSPTDTMDWHAAGYLHIQGIGLLQGNARYKGLACCRVMTDTGIDLQEGTYRYKELVCLTGSFLFVFSSLLLPNCHLVFFPTGV